MRSSTPLAFAPLVALLVVGACGRTREGPASTPIAAIAPATAIAPMATAGESSAPASSASSSSAAPSSAATTTTPAAPTVSSTLGDERCTACCEEESRSCDADCAPGEAGRGCLRRCGSRRISCFQGCAGGPDDMGCRNAKLRPAAAASSGSAAPGVIPCVSDADCWYDVASGRAIPARRPSALRGEKIRPCVDRESVPACRNAVCVLLRYKC